MLGIRHNIWQPSQRGNSTRRASRLPPLAFLVLGYLVSAIFAAGVVWRADLGSVFSKAQYILSQPVRVSPEWGP